ncbi:hypothetical protein ACVWZK_005176 [Bradyrhizobium sp. GM0.4]
MSVQAARAPSPQLPILLRETVGPIAVLTLNRPAARNSLSAAMIASLHAELNEIRDDKSVRGVVIAANGPAFSAGHDMKELTARRGDPDRGRAFFAEMMTACSAMMQAIVHLPKPVVASVQGIATAAGCQLVASCDLAIASEAAHFATPGVDIGLFCSTPMVALSRNVPRKQAMEMLLTGEPIPGRTRSRDRARQSCRRRRQRAPCRHCARRTGRAEIRLYRQARQGGVLPPGRDEPCRCLSLCGRGDDREHDGARRRGRHWRLHREAHADMAG